MSRNGTLPSVAGNSMVSFMWESTEFRWLKKVSACLFFIMLIASSRYLFHHRLGMGHSGLMSTLQSTPYVTRLLSHVKILKYTVTSTRKMHEFCVCVYMKMKYMFNMPNKIQFSGRI